MTLSAGAYIEKNKLSSTNAWLVLLKITMPNTTVIRIVANSENVTWPVTAGNIFTAFPFQLDEIGDTSKGEVPSVSLKVSNAARILEPYLEAQDGLVDSTVNIYVVNSINVTTDALGAGVNNNSPEIELEYEIINSSADIMWVDFTLGSMNPWNKRFPRNKVYKNICRYNDFKGDRCKYAGAQTSCDRSLYTCRTVMLNSDNFGGFPGVGTKGTYV
jgi:lambda family phage minor tail protein L